jgi:Tfp pilus assembly protein PilV
MRTPRSRKSAGFVLLEALIALLIVSIGLLAISKLEGLTISAAGEARSRSEAVTLAQKKLEQLRNWVTSASFTAGMVNGTSSYSGTNAAYNYAWTISAGAAGTLVQLTTTWTDRFGTGQSIDLNSLVAWDDPINQVKSETGMAGINAPAPSGDAKRGDYGVRATDGSVGTVTTPGGPGNVKILENTNTGKTELLNSANQVVLYLDKVGSTFQDFTTISGRVYFDQNAGNNALPDPDNVRVRLSSEGECFYNNKSTGNGSNSTLTTTITAGTNQYTYFDYTCYVGSGWYGNVGVKIDDTVNGNAASPTICVGDPGFNGGTNNGTLTSANPVEAGVRTYRGFYGTLDNQNQFCSNCLSTGVEQGRSIPNDGTVTPGTYPSGATDAYKQYFLLTHISGNNESCYTKMLGGQFANNAGEYYCISPDSDAHSDVCPGVWPGFENAVGTGGTINYTLAVALAGTSGAGSVTSTDNNINCGTTCSASYPSSSNITLNAVPSSGYTVTWNGCSTTNGNSCSVTNITAATTVTATFSPTITNYTLTVQTSGPSGSGTVTSGDSVISCPSTCTGSYSSTSTVTLTATAASGYSFSSWSGCTSTSGNTCTVSMSAAHTVTATFAANVTLTVGAGASTGTGTVTGSPISCTVTAPASGNGTSATSGTCSGSYTSGTTVTLTAAATGTTNQFMGWTGCDSVSGTNNTNCTVTMSAAKSVAALLYPKPCNTTIKGSIHAGYTNAVKFSPSNNGNCSINAGTYTCTIDNSKVSAGGSTTLINNDGNGNGANSVSMTVTATCQTQTNVNFP